MNVKIEFPILKNDFLLNLQSKLIENNIKTEFYKVAKVIVTIETVISKNIILWNFLLLLFAWFQI